MKQSGIQISAILPTLNRSDGIRKSLESLAGQTLSPDAYEVIVVDNGSTDDTEAVVSAFIQAHSSKISVKYLREEQLGLHFARHTGAKSARGPVLAFMDDDALADRKWLEALLEGYRDDSVGCVGGKILPIWEADPPDWVRPFGPGYLSLLDMGDEPFELKKPGIYGCNFSIRKSLLFRVQGFNPDSFGDFWLGDGETGLLRKVLATGLKIMYAPDAIVHHIIPASRLTLEYLKRRARNEGACSSYAAYKRSRPGKAGLLLSAVNQTARASVFKILSLLLFGSARGYRHEIRAGYHWRRVRYDLRLTYDMKLRALVQKEDWLE